MIFRKYNVIIKNIKISFIFWKKLRLCYETFFKDFCNTCVVIISFQIIFLKYLFKRKKKKKRVIVSRRLEFHPQYDNLGFESILVIISQKENA